MGYLNRQTTMGKVGKIYELTKFTKGDDTHYVINLSLAYNENKNGKEHTEWFYCCIYDKAALFVDKHVNVGDTIYVEGKTVTKEFNGTKRTNIEVTSVQLMTQKEAV